MPQQARGAGVEVLGTLTLATPKLEDFQFIKVRVEGEVGHLTLDRPDHNLLNERMLCELAAGINILGEQSNIKLVILDSAAKAFCGGIELGEYTQRRGDRRFGSQAPGGTSHGVHRRHSRSAQREDDCRPSGPDQ